jgi:signal transduction histidine kinase
LSPFLPLKESSRGLIVELARALRPSFPEITAAWRNRMFEEFQFDGRVMTALERLNLGTGFALFCQGDFGGFAENLRYFGTRLAKLQVESTAVARSLELYQLFCEPYAGKAFADRRSEVVAALEMFSSATFVAVSVAYFEAQRRASAALLAVLDAELSAPDLPALLKRVLEITAATFGAQLGVVLLRDAEAESLKVKAAVGFGADLDEDFGIRPGEGFSGRVALTGEPDILTDTDNNEEELNPIVRRHARTLWAVPLKKSAEEIIGVVEIGFAVPYTWLPTERELMRAIADRSALAIDRAQMTDALREREARIAELSGHLLRVQEEERKRISRELHDETGQGLMVIRLYLGMLESCLPKAAASKIKETFAVVDRTIEGLRRMIGRLSPLVLQELGLIAAIRKEAKDLGKNAGVKAHVVVTDDVGRLSPEIETAIYRVVQEALHNVAKHAQARSVSIQMDRAEDGSVHLLVEDDGIGFVQRNHSRGQSFGLAGMRERIVALGGTLKVRSGKGKGTRIEVLVPESPPTTLALPVMAETNYNARNAALSSGSTAS